jgi:transcriptional regulator with XRE-family HTH domain
MKIDPVRLGAAIRELREMRGLTQQRVADQVGLTVNYLSLLENGKRGVSNPTLNRLAEALRISPAIITFLGTNCDESGDALSVQLTRQIQKLIRVTVTAEACMPQPKEAG